MQPSQHRFGDDWTGSGRWRTIRRLERQGLVRPIVVVELDVPRQEAPKMPLTPHDHVIEAFAVESADHPLGDGIGLRRAHRRQDRSDQAESDDAWRRIDEFIEEAAAARSR